MRVIPKLTLAFILSTSAVLAFNGLLRVRREVEVHETDRKRDHRLMGSALGEAIGAVWREGGGARALAVLSHVNTPEARIRVRWVWLDEMPAPPRGAMNAEDLRAAPEGVPVSVVWLDAAGADYRYTYVPLHVDASRAGALELSESLESNHRFVRRTILDTVATAASLSVVGALISMLLGVWIVGRPMKSLIEKARRTGHGDFSGPLLLQQRDELALLGREMNTMCESLVLAHERADAESSARIAALEQLRHADRLMTVGKLASGIAHELGTPLNVVAGRAGMIADGDTTEEETVAYARIIVEAVDKMTRIIRSLLEFARRKGPQKAPQALEPAIARTLELLGPLGAKKGVALELRASKVRPVEVDLNQFEQVVTNLVVNAIQSMSRAGTVCVSLTEERVKPPADIGGGEGPHVRVAVTDEGAGITEEHVAHVFEPFFTTKDVGEGTGLGLSVAYGIVREHGGWIEVRSEPGKGATFAVFLPLEGAKA
jgi:signal transduction histidine kinase